MLRGGGDITGNDCSNFVALIKRRCSRDFCLFIFGNINYGSVLTWISFELIDFVSKLCGGFNYSVQLSNQRRGFLFLEDISGWMQSMAENLEESYRKLTVMQRTLATGSIGEKKTVKTDAAGETSTTSGTMWARREGVTTFFPVEWDQQLTEVKLAMVNISTWKKSKRKCAPKI